MPFENPKVVVVGAGAMGGLFGGLLAEGGLDVTLVDAWPEHIAAIKAGASHRRCRRRPRHQGQGDDG